MADYCIEIQRRYVTVAQFLRYVKKRCAEKGIDCDIERDEFENPTTIYLHSYMVVGDKRKYHFAENRTFKRYRRKIKSYKTSEGFYQYYYTDEFEEYEITELCYWENETSAEDAPCKAETIRSFPCDVQTYILNFDGSCYNEICEFQHYDDKLGYGYYYQVNKD